VIFGLLPTEHQNSRRFLYLLGRGKFTKRAELECGGSVMVSAKTEFLQAHPGEENPSDATSGSDSTAGLAGFGFQRVLPEQTIRNEKGVANLSG